MEGGDNPFAVLLHPPLGHHPYPPWAWCCLCQKWESSNHTSGKVHQRRMRYPQYWMRDAVPPTPVWQGPAPFWQHVPNPPVYAPPHQAEPPPVYAPEQQVLEEEPPPPPWHLPLPAVIERPPPPPPMENPPEARAATPATGRWLMPEGLSGGPVEQACRPPSPDRAASSYDTSLRSNMPAPQRSNVYADSEHGQSVTQANWRTNVYNAIP